MVHSSCFNLGILTSDFVLFVLFCFMSSPVVNTCGLASTALFQVCVCFSFVQKHSRHVTSPDSDPQHKHFISTHKQTCCVSSPLACCTQFCSGSSWKQLSPLPLLSLLPPVPGASPPGWKNKGHCDATNTRCSRHNNVF